MSTVKPIGENKNFTAVDFGKLSNALEQANGKIFLKEFIKATSSEISIGSLPAKTELPFFHAHKQNEEIYIILSGEGKFQIDDECFNVSEGSVVRVAPEGVRGMINTSDKELVYIVVQAKEKSLEQYTMSDGIILEAKSKW